MFLAKVASAFKKPNGLTTIPPNLAINFLEQLPIHRFYGIGRMTTKRMHMLNIHTGKDLKQLSMERMVNLFGKIGCFYYDIVRGIDMRQVTPLRQRKSLGREVTLPIDTTDLSILMKCVDSLGKEVAQMLKDHKLRARTITLKVKYFDFQQVTRRSTFFVATDNVDRICQIASRLLMKNMSEKFCKIRLLGISLSTLVLDSPVCNGQQEFIF
jgi:DNA polymerase-4